MAESEPEMVEVRVQDLNDLHDKVRTLKERLQLAHAAVGAVQVLHKDDGTWVQFHGAGKSGAYNLGELKSDLAAEAMRGWEELQERAREFAGKTLPDCVRKELDGWEEKRARILSLIEPATDAEAVLAELLPKEELEKPWYSRSMRISIGFEGMALQGVLFHLNDVTDISAVVPVLRAFRKRGYKVKARTDTPDYRRREYRMEGDLLMVLMHFPYTEQEGARCRYVKVGVRKEPVYELQCDDKPVDDVGIMREVETNGEGTSNVQTETAD